MTDELSAYGLGALPDAPDERDYPLSALYASEGLVASVVLPASYVSPAMPPVLDQGSSPMCVAYSSSAMKAWQDRRDQERFFDFDEPTFFGQIGGTPAGAYVRDAMERMRLFGYPVAGSGDAGNHRIAAYYAVPRDLATIRAAILDLGPIVVSTTWYRSWFHPVNGVLPAADVAVGDHAIVAYGWDAGTYLPQQGTVVGALTDGTGVSPMNWTKFVKDVVADVLLSGAAALVAVQIVDVGSALATPDVVVFALASRRVAPRARTSAAGFIQSLDGGARSPGRRRDRART